MRKLIILFSIIVLSACSSDKTDNIRDQIKQKEAEIEKLTKEIGDLQSQLNQAGDQDSVIFKTPVEIQQIKAEVFDHYFTANGTVDAVQEAFVSPEINGQIDQILVKEGDKVKQEQLLAILNTSITDNAIKEIKTSLKLAKTVYSKQKQLWDKKIGSEIQYLQAKNNKESLESKLETLEAQKDMAFIKSPIDGVIDEIFLKKGEIVAPGQPFMQLVNLENLYVDVDVSEVFLPAINKNDKVELSFPTYPGESFSVPIYRIGNIIEPDNRTFLVQLKIKNEQKKYKPNMVAIVKINDFSTDSALIIPSIIIKEDLVGTYVYVVKNENGNLISKKRYIKPGRSYNENTMIKEGLKPGDRVIVTGFEQVSDGENISISRIVE